MWVRLPPGVPVILLCEGGREAQCENLQNSKTVGSNPTPHSSNAPVAKLVKAALSKGVLCIPVRVRAGVPSFNGSVAESGLLQQS